MFNGLITIEQFILSAIGAFLVTAIIVRFRKNREDINRKFNREELELILEKCYLLFPLEKLFFGGNTIRRGMKIRIVTNENKIFEGKFIGMNSDEMVCVMTKKYIIAHAIQNIENIEEIE